MIRNYRLRWPVFLSRNYFMNYRIKIRNMLPKANPMSWKWTCLTIKKVGTNLVAMYDWMSNRLWSWRITMIMYWCYSCYQLLFMWSMDVTNKAISWQQHHVWIEPFLDEWNRVNVNHVSSCFVHMINRRGCKYVTNEAITSRMDGNGTSQDMKYREFHERR